MAKTKHSKAAASPTPVPVRDGPAWVARVAVMEVARLIGLLLTLPETDNSLTVFTAKGIAARLQRVNAIVRRIMDDEMDPDTMARETRFLRDSPLVAAILDNGPTPMLREVA